MSDENPASSDPVLPGRQKKKRVHKPGGSFCAFGGCSNRSGRNKTPASQHPGRKFLKFHKLPADPIRRKAWVARMKRDLKWKPSNYTKICSDHFSVSDFSEADLAKWEDSVPGTKPSIIRLKPDAIPNTDRVTGNAVDLLQPENPFKVRRGPPRERNSEPGSSTAHDLDPESIPDHDIELDSRYTEELQTQFELDLTTDLEGSSSSDDLGSTSDEDSDFCPDNEDFNSCSDFSDKEEGEEEVSFFDTGSLKGKIDWVFVSLPLLLSLFKFCPECGCNCRVIKVSKTGFALLITYRCFGVESHQKTWVSSSSSRWNYDINLMFPAMASTCGLGYTLLENVMSGLRIPYCSSTTFYRNLKTHLYPAIVARWELMRTTLIDHFKTKEVDIAGDGHYDSPGWTAKYCTYSILEISTGAILDLFVCQRGMYCGDLEMESCREVLTNLVAKGLSIKTL